MKILISLLVFALFSGSSAHATKFVWIEIPFDDATVRSKLAKSDVVIKYKLSLAKLEHLAIADRTKPTKNGRRPPFNLHCASRKELEKRIGAPVEFKSSLFARSLAADELIALRNIKRKDFDGLVKRAQFYRLNGTGGVRVFYSANGVALSPAITYLEVDDDFPKLDAIDKMDARLKWEKSKTEKLMEWLKVRHEETGVTDRELNQHKNVLPSIPLHHLQEIQRGQNNDRRNREPNAVNERLRLLGVDLDAAIVNFVKWKNGAISVRSADRNIRMRFLNQLKASCFLGDSVRLRDCGEIAEEEEEELKSLVGLVSELNHAMIYAAHFEFISVKSCGMITRSAIDREHRAVDSAFDQLVLEITRIQPDFDIHQYEQVIIQRYDRDANGRLTFDECFEMKAGPTVDDSNGDKHISQD